MHVLKGELFSMTFYGDEYFNDILGEEHYHEFPLLRVW